MVASPSVSYSNEAAEPLTTDPCAIRAVGFARFTQKVFDP